MWVSVMAAASEFFCGSACSIILQGVIPGGAGGPQPPQLLANNTFFGFSHTTDRKIPSEVVLMGSFMSVIYGNVR